MGAVPHKNCRKDGLIPTAFIDCICQSVHRIYLSECIN